MKHLGAFSLIGLWLWPAMVAAAGDDLGQARKLLLGGKYAEAAEIYQRLTPQSPESVLGLARSLAAEGKSVEAEQRLSAAAGEHAELHAELARLAFERGDYQAATAQTDAALRLDESQPLARWMRGELFRVTGRLEEAAEAYRWLVQFYNDHDVRQAESLRWIGLAAATYARWNRLGDQFQFLVNDLYPDILKLEPGYWPAQYEAGLLFLEKHNREDASRHLQAALELNPNAAEVHAALAWLALSEHKPDQAEASLKRAMEIHPRLLDAWLLKAELAWANFQPQKALEILRDHALAICPTSEEALGRMAACYVLLDDLPKEGQGSRFNQLSAEVTARNPHAGGYFRALAAWLDDRNRFAEAERFYRESLQRMPQQLEPKNQLGMMLMRRGREADARRLLEQGFKDDPFNVRVKNTLELFDVLDTLETRKTENGVLRFDGTRDALLGRYAARHLDEVYPKLCAQFGYRPPEPPLVEIFNEARGADGHQWFSTRMVGLPYLGTVAASTGMIVGLVSPQGAKAGPSFNWAQAMTHELVHVITLQQTHYNIPHWFTEGLAVWSEGCARPGEWNELLVNRLASDELLDLNTINLAFSQPHSSEEWQLAYCQAELYVEFMLEGRTPEVLRKMLAAYAGNRDTLQALHQVFGMSPEQFERGYRDYLRKTASALTGMKPPRYGSFSELLQAQEAHPEDLQLSAELAQAYLVRGATAKARELAERVLAGRPKDQLAGYVLARLSTRSGKTDEAVRLLESCLDQEAPEAKTLNLLASLKLKAEDYEEAARLYELGAKHQPYDVRWLRALTVVYLKSNNRPKLPEVLEKIARGDPSHLTARIELAKMALERRDYRGAADWANQALQIDVAEATAHRLLAEAQAERHNYLQAIEEYETVVQLSPSEPQPQLALADVYLQVRKPQEARRVLEALLRRIPDYAVARQMLENLKENEKP
jgi:tetratricopeptide (TPR) repeat protein